MATIEARSHFRMAFRVHRIIKIACGLAIDGHQRQLAQIDTPRTFVGIDPVTVGFRLGGHRRREITGQVKARDCRFGGHLHGTLRIEPPRNPRHGRCGGGGVTYDARDHPIPVAGAFQLIERGDAAQLQPTIRRDNRRLAALDLDGAQECLNPAIDDVLDLTQPAIGRVLGQTYPHPIAMHDTAHLARWQKHTVLQTLDTNEAVSGAIGTDNALGTVARAVLQRRRAARITFGFAAATTATFGTVRAMAAAGNCLRSAVCLALAELSPAHAQLTAPQAVRKLRGSLGPVAPKGVRLPAQVAELVDALVSGTSG